MTSIDYWVTSIKRAAAELDSDKVKSHSSELVKAIERHQAMDQTGIGNALQSALDSFDDVQTKKLCEQLIAEIRSGDNPYLLTSAKPVLQSLQRKRKFGLMLQIADLVIQLGNDEPTIKRLYAQALIEERRLVAAIDVLTQLEAQCLDADHAHEATESRGLLGRAWKQIYMDEAASGVVGDQQQLALQKAVAFYRHEFEQNPEARLWHGINTVALTQRAARDGIELPDNTADTVLDSILATIDRRLSKAKNDPGSALDMWTQATAAEAYLARGDYVQAVEWIIRYVDDKQIDSKYSDAFEVGSTLRQFEEVWQLSTENPEQNKILEILKAALLSREGGEVSISNLASQSAAISSILADSSYEKVLGKDRYKNLRWYQTGLDRAQYVCRIEDRLGDGIGTGFLVRSEAIGLTFRDEWVVLTNAHVVSGEEAEQQGAPAALAPEDANIRFEAGSEPEQVYKITQVLASSPRSALDFSVLAIADLDVSLKPYRIAKRLPKKNAHQRIYIIGHPKGGGISFSLHDNLLLDHKVPKLHYRSPTEGGSSGSPVFNQSWDLIGLHHAGGTRMRRLDGQPELYPANEGISIQSIISAIGEDKLS